MHGPEVAMRACNSSRDLKRPVESINDADEIRRIWAMPKEAGVLLIDAGIGGILLPGPVGTPFLILGGVVLWPPACRGVSRKSVPQVPSPKHAPNHEIPR